MLHLQTHTTIQKKIRITYVMTIACSEILGEEPEQKNWSIGREWYDNYLKDKP
jgi:hypothetical protein